jgi:hypothetical protein
MRNHKFSYVAQLVRQGRLRGFRLAAFALVTVVLFGVPASVAAQSDVALAWNPSSGATGYRVHYGPAPGLYTSSFDVGNQTTAVFHPPSINQVYYFVVRAYNSSGAQSDPSNGIGAWVGYRWLTPSLMRVGDFNGDGRADITVFRTTTGEWFSNTGGAGMHVSYGNPALGDMPVPADYDGDRKTDFAIFRLSTGQWFVSRSRDGGMSIPWGAPSLGDLPVPADYDGDGRADIAVYRRSTGQWFILQSSNGAVRQGNWGMPGGDDMPVPGDYDGDGKADIAVYRRTTGQWFVLFANSTSAVWSWGGPMMGDVPVPADYDGDGVTDIGVFRLQNGTWIVRLSATLTARTFQLGAPSLGDMPVPADFDGDHQADMAVFRSSTATWYIAYARGGSAAIAYGAPTLGDSVAGGMSQFAVVPLQ